MAPVGGKQNETMSKMILDKRQIQKTTFSKFFKFVKERDNMLVMHNYNLKHNAYNRETLD